MFVEALFTRAHTHTHTHPLEYNLSIKKGMEKVIGSCTRKE